MKRPIIYILIITLILGNTLAFADGFRVGDEDIYGSIPNYKNIKIHFNYKDIDKSFAKEDIVKLWVLDVFRGNGEKFSPKSYISRRQALAYIDRALGFYEEDYINGYGDDFALGFTIIGILTTEEFSDIITLTQKEQEILDKRIEDFLKKWEEEDAEKEEEKLLKKDEDITEAQIARELNKIKNQRIEQIRIRTIEGLTWGRAATREEVAIWLARAMHLKEKYPYAMVKGFKDHTSFNKNTIGLIEAFLQKIDMRGFNDGKFKPKEPITREQFAKILGEAIDHIIINRGFQIKEGEILDIKRVATKEEGFPIVQNILYMANIDGSYPVIYTSESNRNNLTKGFSLYRRGKLENSKDLKVYDEIKYYIDGDGNVVYAKIWGIY